MLKSSFKNRTCPDHKMVQWMTNFNKFKLSFSNLQQLNECIEPIVILIIDYQITVSIQPLVTIQKFFFILCGRILQFKHKETTKRDCRYIQPILWDTYSLSNKELPACTIYLYDVHNFHTF